MTRHPSFTIKDSYYKYYLLLILLLIFAFSYIDRHVFAIVMQDMKIDLDLTDTQLGLLSGIAFSFFYAIMGLPIAFLADRSDRIKILSLSSGICCIMVALCGLASNFFQLALARVGVAVGEAGTVPPAHSLIPEYFSRSERARAVSIFLLGASVSLVIGNLFGGWINEVYGWRMAFILVSVPGGLLSIIAWFTLREPRRQLIQTSTKANKFQLHEYGNVFISLWKIPTFRHLLVAFVVMYFFSSGVAQWLPTFFIRHHHISTTELGIWFAFVYGLSTAIGTFAGGEIASRFAANREMLQLRATGVLCAVATFFGLCMLLVPQKVYSFIFMGFYAFIFGLISGPILAIIQTIIPAQKRATALALILMVANIIGLGLGPLATGIISDLLTTINGAESLRYALAIMLPGCFWMALHFWLAGHSVESDIASTERLENIALSQNDKENNASNPNSLSFSTSSQ